MTTPFLQEEVPAGEKPAERVFFGRDFRQPYAVKRLGARLARMRSTTGFHADVAGFFNTSTTPIFRVASSTDPFSAPEIAIISRSGFASWSF